jgi:hypothetical protein
LIYKDEHLTWFISTYKDFNLNRPHPRRNIATTVFAIGHACMIVVMYTLAVYVIGLLPAERPRVTYVWGGRPAISLQACSFGGLTLSEMDFKHFLMFSTVIEFWSTAIMKKENIFLNESGRRATDYIKRRKA